MNERCRRSDLHLVIADLEDAYAVWPASTPVPAGWRRVGHARTRDACLAFVRAADCESHAAVVRATVEQGRIHP